MLKFLDKRMVFGKQRKIKSVVKEIRNAIHLFKDCDDDILVEQYKTIGGMVERLAILSIIVERKLGLSVYDEQLEGALVLIHKGLSEMKTGEGKTLMSVFAISELAFQNKQVHVVTANEYLAGRDEEYLRPVYETIGFSSSLNVAAMDRTQKQFAYQSRIIYSTASEFGFDYLRDRMVLHEGERVARQDYKDVAVVIDEIDSILIDEARTPLIIAQNREDDIRILDEMTRFVATLARDEYAVDMKHGATWLTEKGYRRFKREYPTNYTGSAVLHWLQQAMQARFVQQFDVDYVIKEGKSGSLEIFLVDKNTGRTMEGRRYSNGLHQALEVLHEGDGVRVASDNTTSASITLQNFFRLYGHLCGMSGTALSDAEEFKEVYDLDVYVIPTHRKFRRKDHEPMYFMNSRAKLVRGLLPLIQSVQADKPNPILIGTSNLEHSMVISHFLMRQRIEHVVLNARQDKAEAEIISQAGRAGRITVATNMAGRGSDISVEEGLKLVVINMDINESRRIDLQLLGRTGRQGAEGDTYTLIGLDDYLFRKYTNCAMRNALMQRRVPMDRAISSRYKGLLNRHVLDTVEAIEGTHFASRKQTIKYDSVLNLHSQKFYEKRDEILRMDDPALLISYARKLISGDELNNCMDEIEVIQRYNAGYSYKAALLSAFDHCWIHHMERLEALKTGITYRAYGGDNPLVRYHEEAYRLYQKLDAEIIEAFGKKLLELRKYQRAEMEQVFSSAVTTIR